MFLDTASVTPARQRTETISAPAVSTTKYLTCYTPIRYARWPEPLRADVIDMFLVDGFKGDRVDVILSLLRQPMREKAASLVKTSYVTYFQRTTTISLPIYSFSWWQSTGPSRLPLHRVTDGPMTRIVWQPSRVTSLVPLHNYVGKLIQLRSKGWILKRDSQPAA